MAESIVVYWSNLGDGVVPQRSHDDDGGWDLFASGERYVRSGDSMNVPTGVAVAIPRGWYGHIIGRSSSSSKLGLTIVEAVIDSGYRGELFFQVRNNREVGTWISKGQRLAQILFLPVPNVRWVESSILPPSSRGDRGFGSTGS